MEKEDLKKILKKHLEYSIDDIVDDLIKYNEHIQEIKSANESSLHVDLNDSFFDTAN